MGKINALVRVKLGKYGHGCPSRLRERPKK